MKSMFIGKPHFYVMVMLGLIVSCQRKPRMPQTIYLPISDFAIKSDSTKIKAPVRAFFYMSQAGCSSCRLSAVQEFEERNRKAYEHGGLDFVYVVETDCDHLYSVYAMLCNARLKGHVYIDEAKAFQSSNPSFSENCKDFVFILDERNRVKRAIPLTQVNDAE